ncbi:dephospho-CoA kinase [Sphingobacterium rhinopitheci]|uniref:dephospho-CoA kinase n=1 Tax=Sphingobacterium rhinopitheci TaxID=2781960 RepID=UPI001F524637|nr:dephospho-CoA kinase [Sphingobacterium rhinopitheci]MCI0921410.1 dephospho-CoA kinase [Sphingobacterium rhinopitheci]
MSKKVGITGGIGTGKSFVAKVFKTMGIPFYDADKEAKSIMSESNTIRQAIQQAFGMDTYFEDGSLNRKLLASKVFNNQEQLAILNNIVHPVVIQTAKDWADKQTAVYSLKEAALLFESKSYTSLDYTIVVTAPLELRINRVMERDAVTREEVLHRMNSQMPEEEKIRMADFVIVNDEISPLLPQIELINRTIIKK